MLKNFNTYKKINESVPGIPVKDKYWEERGKSKDKVALYLHDDLDGIYSAVAMKGWLKEKGFKIEKYGIVNYQEGWTTTTLSDEFINIAVDFAENIEGIDIYIDHHGEFQEGENAKGGRAIKSKTTSAYEAVCDQLGIPVDSTVLDIIDMIDAAKYAEHEVDVKKILTFDVKDFNNKKEFAASFNQLLKRSDHRTFIEVVENVKDKHPSIYRIYRLFKKLYPLNNINIKEFVKFYELKKQDGKTAYDIAKEYIEDLRKNDPDKLTPFMKDFISDAEWRKEQMKKRTRSKQNQRSLTGSESKNYISNQKEFKQFFKGVSKNGEPKMNVPGYQILGQMVFVPSGTWSNAIRNRAILQQDLEDAEQIPTINYVVQKDSPLYDELKNSDGEEKELLGDILSKELKLRQDFKAIEDVSDKPKTKGINGVIEVSENEVIFKAKQPLFWIMMQFGNTLQVASFYDINNYPAKYLPTLKDGTKVTDLGKYTDNLLNYFIQYFGYDVELVEDQPTSSGGHGGIGTISNIFGEVGENDVNNTYVKKYKGTRFLDLFKNKMISDLSLIPWSELDMAWNDPEENISRNKEQGMDKKVMHRKDIRKIQND